MKTDLLHATMKQKSGGAGWKLMILLLLLNMGVAYPPPAHASEQQNITLKLENATGRQVLERIREVTRYRVSYVDSDLDQIPRRNYSFENIPLGEAMDEIVRGTTLGWQELSGIIVISKRSSAPVSGAVNLTVSGVVTDLQGVPIIGAAVTVKGGTKGVTTGSQGNYTIEVPRGTTLVYSFLGYNPQERIAGGQAVINVTLEPSTFGITEVVVSTGYQDIAKSKMTGATATVTEDDLATRYAPNVLDNLEGRVAGLVVYGGKAMVRGISSLHAETQPLIVVDGIPYEGTLEDLNPFDIKSVTVLKDAAATAIYGARASNGIIVVTTKTSAPWKEGERNVYVDVNANFTVYQKKNVDYADNFYMTPAQQVAKEREYADYYFNRGGTADPVGTISTNINNGNSLAPVMYAYYQHAKGDISASELERQMEELSKNNFAREYSEHVLRKRVIQQYNVAVRNSGPKYQSNLVLNFRGDNSGYIKARDNRFDIAYKGTYNVAEGFRINFRVNSLYDSSNQSNSERIGTEDPMNPFNVPAYFRLLNDDGSYAAYTSSDYNIYNTMPEDEDRLRSVRFNHLQEMNYDRTKKSRNMNRYHVDMNFNIFRGLSAQTQFSYEQEREEESTYSEADSYTMRFMKNVYTTRSGSEGSYTYKYLLPEHGGKLKTVNSNGRHWTARGQLNYNATFDKHSVDALAGLEFRQTRRWGHRNLLFGYDDMLQSHGTMSTGYTELYALSKTTYFKSGYDARNNIFSYLIEPNVGLIRDEMHRYASGYFNATYTYDRRYNLFASFRRDFTDVFGLDAKYRGKPLWSVGAAWNVHNEDFMACADAVDMLRARLTYGKTGNIYHGATSYMTANSSKNNLTTKQPMSVIETAANPNLKWEQTGTFNFGVDFAMFDNRLSGSLDWYRKKTTDMFAQVPIESTKGFSYLPLNSADMVNNGVELSLSYDWFDRNKDGFYWNSTLTFAYNKNEITKIIEIAKSPSELARNGFKVGYPVNSLFSAEFAGIASEGKDIGRPTWYTSKKAGDGSRLVSASLETDDMGAMLYSGHQDPETSIGFSNYFYYKGFSLNIVMVYYGGHHLRAQQAFAITKGLPYRPLQSYWLNSWTPENEDTNVPGFGEHAAGSIAGETTYTDIYVRSGDFIKIRNIVLGYELPHHIASKLGMRRMGVSFQLDNPKPLWLRNSISIDPETGGLRLPSSYIFGINMNF